MIVSTLCNKTQLEALILTNPEDLHICSTRISDKPRTPAESNIRKHINTSPIAWSFKKPPAHRGDGCSLVSSYRSVIPPESFLE
jgi:hypothetical protein